MQEPIPDQVPAIEGYATVPGARLWYWDTGGDGEPLVLCHPASQSSQIWLYQQPAFAEAGYRVIAYSRRGHFKSDRGPDEDRGTAVGDLAALLDFLGLKRAHVLGAAAGGITAMGFAVAHPAHVMSLVLAGTIVAPEEEEWRALYQRLGLASVRQVVSTEFLELGPSYRALDPEGVARFVELEHASKPDGVIRQPVGATVNWAAMKRLRTSVLLLTGEADLYAPPPLQRMIAAHLPKHEMVTLHEIGHAAYWETPAEFNRIVLRFLRRNRDRVSGSRRRQPDAARRTSPARGVPRKRKRTSPT
jgi:pimeloyl-ACP methyl ester carboxylesterase